METNNDIKENAAAEQGESTSRELARFVWDLVKVLLISMAVILPVRYFIAQPFIVSGASMEPNFYDGEYLIINEIGYKVSSPQRGDIIVFKAPIDNEEYFIKRIIGLPGERVSIQDSQVVIYNQENPKGWVLKESYLPSTDLTFNNGKYRDVVLGSDEFFVMGDNRMASSDSRSWGPVPRRDIVGKVFVRAFPFQNFKKFNSVEYQK